MGYAQSTDWGCDSWGVAGQVFGMQSDAVFGMAIYLEGGNMSLEAFSGAAPGYGLGGYQIQVNSAPANTTTTYRLQLRDLAGLSVSDWYYLKTSDQCSQNLIKVNFVQNHE